MNSFLIVTIIIALFGQVQESQQKDVPLPDLKDIVVASLAFVGTLFLLAVVRIICSCRSLGKRD